MRILQEIDKSKLRLFSISSDQDDTAAPQSLHDLIRKSLKESGFPGQIDPSLLGYVTAILLNEGTIELFQGKTGDGRRHRISVRAAPKNAAAE